MQLSPEQIVTLNEEIYLELLPTYLDLIDQHFKEINPDVIMPPKKSYYIKAKIVEIVRGKPSKPD